MHIDGNEMMFGETVRSRTKSSQSSNKNWLLFLETLNSLSPEISKTIAHFYPSMKSLIDAYEKNCISEKERENLLSGLGIVRGGKCSTTRKIGAVMSKKVYRFLCSDNPNETI